MTSLLLLALLSSPVEDVTCDDTAALAAIYERPGFERARDRNSGAAAALIAQLREYVLSLFETRGAQTYSNVTRVLVLVAALLAAVLAIARRRARAELKAQTPARPEDALVLDEPAAHFTRAQALLEADTREAIREGLFSLLASLERRALITPRRSDTNRELLAVLPRNGAPATLTDKVTPLLTWYDRAFYSLQPVPPGEARAFLDGVQEVTA